MEKLDKKLIGQRLVALRGKKSQRAIAERCNISVSALGMYETGKRIPRDEVKVALAKELGRSVQYIFFDKTVTQSEHLGEE